MYTQCSDFVSYVVLQLLDELWGDYEAMEDKGTLPKPDGTLAGVGAGGQVG